MRLGECIVLQHRGNLPVPGVHYRHAVGGE
jgi:hypothetical protein